MWLILSSESWTMNREHGKSCTNYSRYLLRCNIAYALSCFIAQRKYQYHISLKESRELHFCYVTRKERRENIEKWHCLSKLPCKNLMATTFPAWMTSCWCACGYNTPKSIKILTASPTNDIGETCIIWMSWNASCYGVSASLEIA